MRQLPPMNALRIFEEVVKHLNFSHAAQSLCLTHGAVSRQIKLLEEYLGVQLFLRSPKGIELTSHGLEFANDMQVVFDQIEVSTLKFRAKNIRSKLNIEAPPTWCNRILSPNLKNFLLVNKDYSFTVNYTQDAESHEVAVDTDIRIRFGLAPSNHCQSSLLLKEDYVMVASPQLFKEGLAPNIQDYPLIHVLYNRKRLDTWQIWLQQNHAVDLIDSHCAIEFSTTEQVIQAAVAGYGIAIIDKPMIQNELHTGLLKAMIETGIQSKYGYWIDIPFNKATLPKVQIFKSWLEKLLIQ
ncbi:LysR family transcriptional regulator [Acinetobacter sp. ESBL14]|uniref:LysR family transcriptional regulator n=1 Tax=Acinetobacter sp. ESBL14 TaxID=3077329 RepID=UPI002FC668B1